MRLVSAERSATALAAGALDSLEDFEAFGEFNDFDGLEESVPVDDLEDFDVTGPDAAGSSPTPSPNSGVLSRRPTSSQTA
jgi:hypothetical protein